MTGAVKLGGWLVSWAAAAPEPAASEVPAPVIDPHEAEIAALRQELLEAAALRDRAVAAADAAAAQAAADTSTWVLVGQLLDDRLNPDVRIAAAEGLGEIGGSRTLVALRAAAGDRNPEVQRAAALVALHGSDPAGAEVARRVLLDEESPRYVRLDVVAALGERSTQAAAHVLYDVSAQPGVPAVIRANAIRTLESSYPKLLASWGGAPAVVDPLGGVLFVSASGLAGGIVLSSVGQFGEFGGSVALGAVGGSAIGLAGGSVFAATRPLTFGQGTAFASGVGFGLAYGLWTTTAIHGGWAHLPPGESYNVARPAAAYRALGMVGGAAAGAVALAGRPSAWDVLEVDAAGYLGSAIALGATALATYRPPDPTTSSSVFFSTSSTRFSSTPGFDAEQTYRDYGRAASQRHAVAELVGATAGLGAGLALRKRWDLEPEDAFLGLVLGGEAAWIGGWSPVLLDVDASRVKGNVRLPWNAGIAGGLVLAEGVHPTWGRTFAATWGSLAFNTLGAGVPMLIGYDDARSVAAWMVPAGAIGTAAGFVADPFVAPTAADWVMVGVGTTIAAHEGFAIGAAIDAFGGFVDSGQVPGLGFVTTGVAASGLYAASAFVEPQVDEMLMLGSAGAWGAAYGALGVLAVAPPDGNPGGMYLAEALTSAAFAGGTAAGMWVPDRGLRPGSTVLPQLGGLTGGTLAALGVGLATADGQSVALGALVGTTVGFGGGALAELARAHRGGGSPRLLPGRVHVQGHWLPMVEPHVGPDGSLTPVAGVQGLGW